MIRKLSYLSSLFLVMTASASLSCTILIPTKAQERALNSERRLASKPVSQDRQCAFVNGGILDSFNGGPAKRLEKSRFYQVLGTVNGVATDVLAADCGSREVIRVISGFVRNENHAVDSCVEESGDRHPILKPSGPLSLEEGGNLSELVEIARETKMLRVDERLKGLLEDDLGNKVPRKDRFDLLCGCKLFHKNTPGAAS